MPTRTQPSSDLTAAFRWFADRRAGPNAPWYATLARGIATDPDLLALAAHARHGQSAPDLLLACVQYLLDDHHDSALAACWPNPSTTSHNRRSPAIPPDDAQRAFRRFCLDHRAQLAQQLATRLVQTNEVGRCTYLLPAIQAATDTLGPNQPIALLEVGASAGLNLLLDRYHYRYHTASQPDHGWKIGDPTSPVRLACQLRGPEQPPADRPLPVIAWRAGLDLQPLSVLDPQAVRWLRALIWPDHPHRRVRLDHAIELARHHPPRLQPGDALDTLPALLATIPDDLPVVVMHTAVLAHIPQPARARLQQLIPALAHDRPIRWVHAEPRPDAQPRLRVTTCTRGKVNHRLLGDYHPHGDWLAWRDQPTSTT